MWSRFFAFISSLKLTVFCLGACLVLVFAGTIAQVNQSIHVVQERYFQSIFVWYPTDTNSFQIPVFPGGHLLGAILLVNLIAAHVRRFQWTWRKLGIQLTHAGLIIMLAGGLFTDLFSVESFLRLELGETKNYSEDQLRIELAVIDETDPDLDQVTAIPEPRLRRGGTIEHSSLPFRLVVRRFYPNAQVDMIQPGTSAEPAATQGIGSRVSITELPPTTAMNGRDAVSVVVEVLPPPAPGEVTATSLGTWLVSDLLGAPQTFSSGGRQWRLVLRPIRHYKPYSITLQKFTHERYPGTEIPKNFASRITLVNPEQHENRDALIYMNNPLRYQGETYYQAGFDKGDKATILQVVRNPSFVAPYVACLVVALGLIIQFSFHLIAFSRRTRKPSTAISP
jgi:hypothetical protein